MGELATSTIAQLRVLATEHGIDLTGLTLKADILAAIEAATTTETETTDVSDTTTETTDAVEGDSPAVPARVRTVAYYVLLALSGLVLLATGLAPVWLDGEVATRVVASAGVVTSVAGLIAGGLGVAYRPTR